jgi:hypothetical protein
MSSKVHIQPVYTGIFFGLSDEEKEELLSQFVRSHPTTHLHHLTLKFQPSWDEVRELPLGQEVWVTVTGLLDTEKVQAFVVDSDSLVPCKCTNDTPHITVATAEGVKPFHSNAALKENGWQELDDTFFLAGRVGMSASDGKIYYQQLGGQT